MKKPLKIAIFSAIGICALLLLIFFRKRDFDSFVTAADVNKIEIMNGNNGDIMTITDQADMNKILVYMDDITYRRKFVLPWGGWSYRFMFYQDENLLSDIVIASSLADIDGKNYSYKNSNTTTMEEMLSSLTNSIFVTQE